MCLLQDGPYGFSEAAQPYDDAVQKWANTLEGSHLLANAVKYVNDAKTCGFVGLVLLHGLLSALPDNGWSGRSLANFHPSYYGMMVAAFKPHEQVVAHNEL